MTTTTSRKTDETPTAREKPTVFSATDMLRYKAAAEDATFPIRELFFEPEKGVLRFVAIDVGGWFDRREVIVSADLMGVPDDVDRVWPVVLSPDAIKDAPEWTDPKALSRNAAAAMPPVMIGPYGGHFAGVTPLDVQDHEDADESPGNLEVEGFARVNEWVGLPVTGQDGDVGTLIDFLFEPDNGSLSHVVVDTGGFLAAQQMVLPFDLLKHRAEGRTSAVVMEVTEKVLREAPPLAHFDLVNRSWIDALRSYYQLLPRS